MSTPVLYLKSELKDRVRSWVFSGPMTVFELNKIQTYLSIKNINKTLLGADQWLLDFESVSKMDTAGIAYFLACMRAAKLHACPLSVRGFPEEAQRLAKAQGVFELIF